MEEPDLSDIAYRIRRTQDEDERERLIVQYVPDYESYKKMVDALIEKRSLRSYLEDLEDIFPEYELTDRQQIYLDLMTANARRDTHIDNEWLHKRAIDAGLEEPEYLMYRIANDHGLYRISMPSDETVDSYSINLLWVNYMPQDREADTAEHIFGDGLSDSTLNRFTSVLSEWRQLNPDAEINLWFDSALVTERAYLNTKEILDSIDVRLRDIRNISNVPKYVQLSLHPITQIYYRVDILKALIADYLFSEDARYIVVTDVDVAPMSEDILFNALTLESLNERGYVFSNSGDAHGMENSFFIFDSTRDDVRDIHREYLIDAVERDFLLMVQDGGFWYDVASVFNKYRKMMPVLEDNTDGVSSGFKAVDAPISQFSFFHGAPIKRRDYRAERFRFSDREDCNPVPCISLGERTRMTWLKEFVPEPLDIIE